MPTVMVCAPIAALLIGAAGAPPTVTLESLLKELTDRAAIARQPGPAYTCRQSSSYDRRSKDPADAEGWFANDDANQFVRVEEHGGRKEYVMHDADGPGAIVHVWSANPKGTLRVYLDGSTEPAIEAPMADLLRAQWKIAEPLSIERARGCNLYLPIPYARHCTITCDKDGFYYQVNYRTYEPGTAVESLTPMALDAAAPAIARTCKDLTEVGTAATAKLFADTTITPGSSRTAQFPEGPGAVSRLFVWVRGENQQQAMRSTVVRMTFDGEETVWCPVGDLFALGPGLREFRTWWASAGGDGSMRLKFPMPFEKSASITFENLGSQPVTVDARFAGMDWAWDDRSMHFHATWRDEYPLHTRPMKDWNYVEITGGGVYVGDVLSLMNPSKDWWGEGDEKIYVDGETFPSHFGTGTEDYYSYAWSSPQTFSGIFNAQPRSDGEKLANNWGRATVTRTRSLDAIPFTKSLRFDMEIWHWKECDVEYAATTYFYARPGATTNRKPDPAAAARTLAEPPPLPPPYKVAGAIECEGMQVVGKSDGVAADAQGGFEEAMWSGQKQLWVRARRIGDFVELRIPANGTGAQHVVLYATRSWDYATVRFDVNGTPTGPGVDLCSGERKVVATGPIDLGEFTPVKGAFVLRAEVVGTSPAALEPKTYFGLDCVVLIPAGTVK